MNESENEMQNQFNTSDDLSATSPYGEAFEEYDPRFIRDTDDPEPAAPSAGRMRKHRSLAEARQKRDRLVADLSPLAALGVDPSGPPLSRPQVALLLGLSHKTVRSTVARNADEVAGGDAGADLLDMTAVARLALLTRHSASPMVGRIHRALDPESARPILRFASLEDGPTATHRGAASAALETAYGLITSVWDQDPAVVWERARGMAPEEAAAVIVVLAAIVPDDRSGLLDWVKGMTPDGTVAAGLCQIIPTPQTAADGRALSTTITDAELGLR
jgi:hypothetical protein